MWQSMFSPADIATRFESWIETDEFARLMSSDETLPSCFLDLIEMWVTFDDATEVCPTYETFLLVVIAMMGDQYRHPFEWTREDGTTIVVSRMEPLRAVDAECTPGVTDHRIFHRDWFEFAQAGRRHRQQFTLEQQMIQLTARGETH